MIKIISLCLFLSVFSCGHPQQQTVQVERFLPGIISSAKWDENIISFADQGRLIFFTRTHNWTHQSAYITMKAGKYYTPPEPIEELDSIYNGAISPRGNRIIYCIRQDDQNEIWLIERQDGQWTLPINLTKTSGIRGGYFYWLNEENLFFYIHAEEGNIVQGRLKHNMLTITDSLTVLNTKAGVV